MSENLDYTQDIKVSVCVVTYNQRKYIAECLDSILQQEANFRFEIIVGDDASTDGTSEIVLEYANRYPEIIIPVLHHKNIGATENYFSVHRLARGKYISHIDGDDLALPNKLQRCCDILDNDATVNIVFHRMKLRSITSNKEVNDRLDTSKIGRDRFTRADLLSIGSIACHSSKMYRSSCKEINQRNSETLDYYLDITQVGSGVAHLINEFLGVYRVNSGVTQSGKTKAIYLKHLRHLMQEYPQYSAEIGANALTCALADLKNRRETTRDGFSLFLKCLSFRALLVFMRTLHLRKLIRTRLKE